MHEVGDVKQLSEAIEKFSDAADRLDGALSRAERRAKARADGAEAQGDVILRLRGEIETLKRALDEAGKPVKPSVALDAKDDRIEPGWAAG